jgi:hypothetical protein
VLRVLVEGRPTRKFAMKLKVFMLSVWPSFRVVGAEIICVEKVVSCSNEKTESENPPCLALSPTTRNSDATSKRLSALEIHVASVGT